MNNFVKTGEYIIDGITTLSGIGNLAKFRHLAKIGQAGSIIAKIKLGAGIVEVTSGVTNTLLKLTGFEETELGKSLQKYLFYIELLSLSGELTAALKNGLQKSAKEILEHSDDLEKQLENLIKKGELDEVSKQNLLDELYEVAEISLLNRGRLTGQILDEVAISKIKSFLSKNKVELQIGKEKGIFEVEGYFYPSGKTVIMEPKNAAMFITDGVKMKLVLRENATVLEFLHEFMHFNHCKSLGTKSYFNLKGVDGLITRERYVFDKLMEHKQYLNRKELIHSKKYMDEYYYIYGIEDINGNQLTAEFNFDIKLIPKKRQEANIDKLLNLK